MNQNLATKEQLEEKAYLPNGIFGFVFKRLKGYAVHCELCNIRISSTSKSIKLHTRGKKHSREIAISRTRPYEKPKKYGTSSKKAPILSYNTSIQEYLDVVKESLIGLEYILEIVASDDAKKPVYFCVLCIAPLKPNDCSPASTAVLHLKSYNHKINYLKEHFPTTFEHLDPLLTNTQKAKSKHSRMIVDRIVDAIETTFGRLKPAQVDPLKFQANRNNYLDAIRRVKHHKETPGHTFENLVTRRDIFNDSKEMHKTDKPLTTDEKNFSLDNCEDSVKTGNSVTEGIRENRNDRSSNSILHQRVRTNKQDTNESIYDSLEKELIKYKENPEDHPQYNNEWIKFWKEKYMELKAQGKDPSTYDFKPEWKTFWDKRVMELHLESKKNVRNRKLSMDDDFNIGEVETIQDSQTLSRKRRRSESYSVHGNSSSHNSDFCTLRIESPPHGVPRIESTLPSKNSPPRRRDSLTTCRESPTSRKKSSDRRDSLSQSKNPPPHSRDYSHSRNSPFRNRDASSHRRMSPSLRKESPCHRRELSSHHGESPSRRRLSPSCRRDSPPRRRNSPFRRRDSSSLREDSSSSQRDFLSRGKGSPSRHRGSPLRSRDSPYRRRESPNNISRSNNISCPPEKINARGGSPLHNESKRQRRMPNQNYSPPEKSKNTADKRQNRYGSDDYHSKKHQDSQVSDDGIISVLRLLTAVEENLGSLGPKIVDLLSEALSMESNKVNSSKDLLTNKNIILLVTVKEKLKGHVQAGFVSQLQVEVFKDIIKKIENLVARENQRKKQKKEESTNDFIIVPGVGMVDRDKICREVVNILLAQGKKDITERELIQLIKEWVQKEPKTDLRSYDTHMIGSKRFLEEEGQRDKTKSLVMSLMSSMSKRTYNANEIERRIDIPSKFPLETITTNELSLGSNTVQKVPEITRQNMMLPQPMTTQNYPSQAGNLSSSSGPFTRNSYDATRFKNITHDNTKRVDMSTIRSSVGYSLSGYSNVNPSTPYTQLNLSHSGSSSMNSNMLGASLRGDAYHAKPSFHSSNQNALRGEAFNSRIDFRNGPGRYGAGLKGYSNSAEPKTNFRTYNPGRDDLYRGSQNNKDPRYNRK